MSSKIKRLMEILDKGDYIDGLILITLTFFGIFVALFVVVLFPFIIIFEGIKDWWDEQ